jgi:hypothetical protein
MAQTLQILEVGNSSTNINIFSVAILFSQTSAQIVLSANSGNLIGSYSYKLERLTYVVTGGTAFSASTVVNTFYKSGPAAIIPQANPQLHTFTSLVKGAQYRITARTFIQDGGAGQTGNLVSYDFTMAKDSAAASIIQTATPTNPLYGSLVDIQFANSTYDPVLGTFVPATITSETPVLDQPYSSGTNVLNNKTYFTQTGSYLKTTKSLFKLSQSTTNNYAYTTAYKSFSQLNTSQSYYLFGANLFFDATLDKPNQSGGVCFFVSNDGMDGYYAELQTTASSASLSSSKQFQIFRIKSGVKSALLDTQIGITKTLAGVYGGQTYKIDIKVAVESTKRTITAYVNGFKITAVDDSVDRLPITDKVAMVCRIGTVYFDYIYGMHIGVDSYNQDSLINVYEGKYPKNIISFLYGERVNINDPAITPINSGFIEEFGAVARELRVLKTKYESRPAFPVYASTGVNSFAKIIGQRLSSSGAEVYVLNNSGTYIPLDDSQFYSFYILGNYISQSGEIEYIENSAGEYSSAEPITFTSSWIQKNSDVIALANWIKNVWSKKQSILEISIFGNPLLTVGDVISVNYPYLELTTAQKFLITDVNHSYKEGLETSIVCRTL